MNREVGKIVGKIGELFKTGKGKKLAAEERPLEKPLMPILQRNLGIVKTFAQAYGLGVFGWQGQLKLMKRSEKGYTYEVIGIIGNDESVTFNINGVGKDDYLTQAQVGLLEPIHRKGEGDNVILIGRDIEVHAIAGVSEVDTRKRS